MELGFKKLDKEAQKSAKRRYEFHVKSRNWKIYILYFLLIIWIIFTCWMGIKAITDQSYLSRFLQSLVCMVVTVVVCFTWKRFLDWLFSWVFKRQNNEKLPEKSQRSLRKVLNRMNGNVGGLVWLILWGDIAFSALLVGGMESVLSIKNVVSIGGKMLIIFLMGHFFFQVIHRRRNLTKRLLQNTVGYYNYGDGKLYAEYVDWSIRENMLLCCKQYVVTEEFFLGYAHTDVGFQPVAIPREFIKEAEVREALYSNRKLSMSRAILACKLYNGKVIDFYLSRFMGSRLAIDLLHKHGFEFAVRNDVVEYQ